MYGAIGRTFLDNHARLIYAASKAVGNALMGFQGEYPSLHSEVCINEKVAYEQALAGACAGKRTACLFTTEGLYEALDPVMSSAYTGVAGGFVVVCMKETEEDVTPLGPFAKLPTLVVAGFEELARAVRFGYTLSETYRIPVLIQTGPDMDMDEVLRFSTGTEMRVKGEIPGLGHQVSSFVKDPGRWAATPKYRYQLHKALNEKLERIRAEFEAYPGNVKTLKGKSGVITDRYSDMDFCDDDASILFISTVYPLPSALVNDFMAEMDEISVSEGPYPTIELQIGDRRKIISEKMGSFGRRAKPVETMYGFTVVRDTIGPASSINLAHGMKISEPDRKVLAVTFEDHFFHSGMAAFVNTLYNRSSYVLLILVSEKEEQIRKVLEGFGFHNSFHIEGFSEIERFYDHQDLAVLFCKGII
ncbi:hypothetical protein [Syntrophorhabdus aromaticivorans]|uniref:Uncharacterized protein n=1 Tax=Syntrophorhabdus aromaticivorans TaxID=328301 RepID=A0A351U6A0_9BACT|nr:hypothetical protein [Syntrophorhabdus aromaticivorans]NLW36048.1 hypothetical protein [Syntrophorhabdus aromaticivorans]HBA55481.1 hypothetical protein [Syntrophorhabdus aromaticivorans]